MQGRMLYSSPREWPGGTAAGNELTQSAATTGMRNARVFHPSRSTCSYAFLVSVALHARINAKRDARLQYAHAHGVRAGTTEIHLDRIQLMTSVGPPSPAFARLQVLPLLNLHVA